MTVKNLVFPMFCRMCKTRLLTEENGYFCPRCWEDSPRIVRPFCTVCGKPHRGAVGFGTQSNFPCDGCREAMAKRGWPTSYRRIGGAAYYEGAVEEAVKLLKFNDKRRLARPLGELMAEFALRELEPDTYSHIVPVPLHRVRYRDRGFNQADLLVEAIGPVFRDAEVSRALRRIRPTRVQSRLSDEKARRANVAGAFAVDRDVTYNGARVLLVDDVVTSGGTVAECARALRRAGAERVDVLCAALAVRAPALPA